MLLIIFSTILAAATPLLLAALGELLVEKSGVLNLGIEGMMLFSAIIGFIGAIKGYPAWFCFSLAAFSGLLLAALFAVWVLFLRTNQVATGLALSIFGGGLSALIGADYVGKPFLGFAHIHIEKYPELNLDYVMLAAPILVILTFLFLYKTKVGLVLRAVGENHQAAYALGYPVLLIRFIAILFGGAMAGLAGAYMSLVSPHLWTLGLTAGRGWIALALVVFAAWRPFRLLFGAYLFGAISVLQFSFQNSQIEIPSQFWAMLPYLATIVVLVMISAKKQGAALHAPADLGKPFIPH